MSDGHTAHRDRAVSRTDFTIACCSGMSRQWARSVILMMPASRAHSQASALPYTGTAEASLTLLALLLHTATIKQLTQQVLEGSCAIQMVQPGGNGQRPKLNQLSPNGIHG